MTDWGSDPELVATFEAEVQERLASLQSGLLALESHPAPRQLVAGLFRDAHTVKGSARMLGLEAVLRVAHAAEDLLGALRDGRLQVDRALVDLLLGAGDCIGRAMPGSAAPVEDSEVAAMVEALAAALRGRPAEPTAATTADPAPAEPRMEQPTAAPTTAPPATAATSTGQPTAAPTTAPPDTAEPSLGGSLARQRLEPAVPSPRGSPGGGSDLVRVAAAKVYELLDVVGEAELGSRRVMASAGTLLGLAAEQSRWATVLRQAAGGQQLSEAATLALHRVTATGEEITAATRGLRELADSHRGRVGAVRDAAMGLAMVPVQRILAALPRLVRDLALSSGKEVRLELSGQDVELDKQVLDGVADSLKHLVINAVDHGCEPPAERRSAGKPAATVVRVAARSVGDTVLIEVADDGRGVDEQAVRRAAVQRGLLDADAAVSRAAVLQLLFAPALSTASTVTDTSGRGVGLDVVRASVQDLGGTVEVRSEVGQGTSFVLTLPVTLGVLRCLLARVGAERYAVPVAAVVESISLRDATVHRLAGVPVVARRGVSLPLLDLGAALGLAGERAPRAALVVRHGERTLAWAVDALEGELELVVTDLGPFLGRVPVVPGATIDSDGSVLCLLDLRELADQVTDEGNTADVTPARAQPARGSAPAGRPARVLVVEDSVGVRELERAILEAAGYRVETAVDGLDGAGRVHRSGPPADLVLSDVEMPGMDGFTLTRTIRRTPGWEQVPVVIMTSRGDDGDRRAGLEAGASAYLLKSEFDQAQLVDTVRRLVGR